MASRLSHAHSRSSLAVDAPGGHSPSHSSHSGGHAHTGTRLQTPMGRASHSGGPSSSPRDGHHEQRHQRLSSARRSRQDPSPAAPQEPTEKEQIWIAIGKMDEDIKKLKDDDRSDTAIERLDEFKVEYQRQLDKDDTRWREQKVQTDRLMGMVRMLETETADLRARLDKVKRAGKNAQAYSTLPSALGSVACSRRDSAGGAANKAEGAPTLEEMLSGVAAALTEDAEAEGEEEMGSAGGKFHRAHTITSISPASFSTAHAPTPQAPPGSAQARSSQTARRRSQQAGPPSSLSVLHEGHSADEPGEPGAVQEEEAPAQQQLQHEVDQDSPAWSQLVGLEGTGSHREEPPQLAEAAECSSSALQREAEASLATEEQHWDEGAGSGAELGPAEELEFAMVQSAEEVTAEEQLRFPEEEASGFIRQESEASSFIKQDSGASSFIRQESSSVEEQVAATQEEELPHLTQEQVAAVGEEELPPPTQEQVAATGEEELLDEDILGMQPADAASQATDTLDGEKSAGAPGERASEEVGEEAEEWDCCEESGESSAAESASASSSNGSYDAFDECEGDDLDRMHAGEVLADLKSDQEAAAHQRNSVRETVSLNLDQAKLEAEDRNQVKAALVIQRIWRFGAKRFDLSAITGGGESTLPSQETQLDFEEEDQFQPLPASGSDRSPRAVPRMERRKTILARNTALMQRVAPGEGGQGGQQISCCALLEAVQAGNEELSMVLLLTANARMVNQVDSMGRTPLHLAAKLGMAKVCDALLRNRNFESADSTHIGGWTALHVAARQGKAHVVKVILRSDRFHAVNTEDDNGRTALHAAAVHGSVDVVRAILEHPGFTAIDLQNFGGFTALHVAERHGHAEVCAIIVQFSNDQTRQRASLTPGSCKHRRATANQHKKEVQGRKARESQLEVRSSESNASGSSD